jgi:hypothetical protein
MFSCLVQGSSCSSSTDQSIPSSLLCFRGLVFPNMFPTFELTCEENAARRNRLDIIKG